MVEQATRVCIICRKGLPRGVHPDTGVCRDCELRRQESEGPLPSESTESRRMQAFIDGSFWRLARTMLEIPHQYTVRDLSTPDARRTTAMSHRSFEWFVSQIREHGTRRTWGPYKNHYLTLGGWEYWTMGFPVPDTTIINRQAVGPEPRETMAALVLEARQDLG